MHSYEHFQSIFARHHDVPLFRHSHAGTLQQTQARLHDCLATSFRDAPPDRLAADNDAASRGLPAVTCVCHSLKRKAST